MTPAPHALYRREKAKAAKRAHRSACPPMTDAQLEQARAMLAAETERRHGSKGNDIRRTRSPHPR